MKKLLAAAATLALGLSLSATPAHAATGLEQPVGRGTGWTRTFTDDFTGSKIDTTKWATNWFGGTNLNGTTKLASNIAVHDGNAFLSTDSNGDGAILTSNPYNGGGGASPGFTLPVGSYAEARIYFPGSGTKIYNWPAWWVNGQSWPKDGEIDVFEGLGTATSNYHYLDPATGKSAANNSGTIPGTWSNAYHSYAVYRTPGKNYIYWDGKLIRSYTTYDNGGPEYFILTSGGSRTSVAKDVKVDYVRAWKK